MSFIYDWTSVFSNAQEKDGTVAEKLQQILFGPDSETRRLFKTYLKESFPETQNKAEGSHENQTQSSASTSKENPVLHADY